MKITVKSKHVTCERMTKNYVDIYNDIYNKPNKRIIPCLSSFPFQRMDNLKQHLKVNTKTFSSASVTSRKCAFLW